MKIQKFQEGGAAPAPAAAPQDQAMQQLAQMAQEIIQQLGPEGAAALAQMIIEMLQGAPEQIGAQPQEQQFMRKGGKLVKCGGKMKSKKACGGKMRK
jgi:hypothetical protein